MNDTAKPSEPTKPTRVERARKTVASSEQKEDVRREKEHARADAKVARKRAAGGKPRNKDFLSWEEAKLFMREEMIPSQVKYMEWWNKNKPKVVPRFPYRVYKEWTSWNDFLGTDNKWGEKKSWRDFDQATLWCHTLKLETMADWTQYAKTAPDFPDDIPKRPDLTYKHWRSWSHWLGNKPAAVVEVRREVERLRVYYIIREQGVPNNIFTVGVASSVTELKERWNVEQFDVIKLFWYDAAHDAFIENVVRQLSSGYMGNDRQRIMPNVYEVIWHLQTQLDIVKL